LFDLTNTPFDAAVFKAACETIAPFDAASSDQDLWAFKEAHAGFTTVVHCCLT
jgi:hypothetical protein